LRGHGAIICRAAAARNCLGGQVCLTPG
jgi:hypothetical protein